MLIEQLPPILIIHLKCFLYDEADGTKKLMKLINYSINLTLPKSEANDLVRVLLSSTFVFRYFSRFGEETTGTIQIVRRRTSSRRSSRERTLHHRRVSSRFTRMDPLQRCQCSSCSIESRDKSQPGQINALSSFLSSWRLKTQILLEKRWKKRTPIRFL